MRRTCPKTFSLKWLSFLLILFALSSAQAQSGRRTPKGSKTPVEPQATPEPTPAKPAPKPLVSMIVISDISQTTNFSFSFPERMQAWVTQRLRDASVIEATEGGRGTRKEAINRAKAATEVFIVFLQLETNTFSQPGRANLDEARINYSIFMPVTGKTKSAGIVYLGQSGSLTSIGRGRTVPLCYPAVRGNDYYLLQASLETADRILSSFNVPSPPICP